MDKIEAVVFDMDGLMFDTERIWVDSVMKTNKEYNTNITKEFLLDCMGLKNSAITERFKEILPSNIDVAEFRNQNSYYVHKEIDEHGPGVKKGLFELLEFLKAHNIKMGVATSSYSAKIDKSFSMAGLSKDYFKVIICGDQLTESKPHPQIYLMACEMLGVNPKNAIALEDSANGLLSAYRAGMKPVFIKDMKEHGKEILDLVYKRFDNLSQVISLFI